MILLKLCGLSIAIGIAIIAINLLIDVKGITIKLILLPIILLVLIIIALLIFSIIIGI